MLFNSIHFLVFFPVVTMIYFLIPSKVQYIWLLAASYYFYMCWNAKYVLLLLFSTAITYLSGRAIEYFGEKPWKKHKIRRYKKYCVAGSFLLNLSLLFWFKYFDFTIANINRILAHCNLSLLTPSFDVILPVGISFYIFQALSYTMDAYRGEIQAEKNFLKYALFVSFFPQLVAGPIERSKHLLSQIQENHHFDFERMRTGLLIMIWGYFQKLVLADRIAIIVDTVYNNVENYQGCYFVVASVMFAIQIYCDFSGYSMIAIGAAKIMGFQLMDNFDCPYMARSVEEFWRRWHISLTSWLLDYLYIPLGGNKKGKLRKYINIMIVFLTSGLWHGAQWTYVVWGGLNGLFQIIGDATKGIRKWIAEKLNLHTESIGHVCLKVVCTFFLIDLTMIFFRANSLKQAFSIIYSIFTVCNPWIFFNGSLYELGLTQRQFWLMIFATGILIASDAFRYRKIKVAEIICKQDLWCRWLIYISAVLFIIIFGVWGVGYDAQAFVYFQF